MLTRAMQRLVFDAEVAGYEVDRQSHGLSILKLRPHHRPSRRIWQGVWVGVSDTGAFYCAHRIDVSLDIALKLRTIKAVRQALGLRRLPLGGLK